MSAATARARLVVEVGGGRVELVECLERRVCRALEERGYLQDRALDPLEAGFMLARCVARLRSGGCGWVEAVRAASLAGPAELFMVYYDLRRRGRIVRRGVRPLTLVVDYGGSRLVEVLVLREGAPISIGRLITWSRLATGDGREPVIAVVDGHGDVTYYTARAVRGFR